MKKTIIALAMFVSAVGFAQEAEKPKPVAPEAPKARPDMAQMCDKMFAEADTNKDGVLSKEEFSASMKKRMEGRGMGRGMGGGQGGPGMGRGQGGGMKAPPMAE